MKILVFGAAFDPPHNGHMTMAREAVKRGIADRVIFIPCGTHAFLKNMSPASDRFLMTKIVVDSLNKTVGNHFELSDIEIKREGVSYTWETLASIATTNPNDEIAWLMGSDLLSSFDKWEKYEEILAKYKVYVYPRKGYSFVPFYPGMIKIEGAPIVDISSTGVRRELLSGNDIASMVMPKVAQYIKEKKLWIK